MKKAIALLLIFVSMIHLIPVSANEIDPWQNVSDWKRENGYDFPVYGTTSVDLSPISDYLNLLKENNILVKLPELNIYHYDTHDWVHSVIGDSFWLTYLYYFDGSLIRLCLEVPSIYRPKDKALVLMIVSMLSIDEEDAEGLYSTLQYNVIDEYCTIETEDYELEYFEPRYSSGELMGFVTLTVDKKVKNSQGEQNSKSPSAKQAENGAPLVVPPGQYIVGEDIPAGVYRLAIADDSKTAIILVNEPGEYGRTMLYETLGKYGGTSFVGKIELKSGYLVYVYSSNIDFYVYDGLK